MRDIKKGTYNGEFTYCPVNGYDCPYCDKNCVCHIDDPCKDCDDFNFFFPTWADWEGAEEADGPDDFSEEEIEWMMEHAGYNPDMGYDPFAGCYTDDC